MPKFLSAKIHDRLRLEFKLRYPPNPNCKNYKTTFWIYLPPSIKNNHGLEQNWFENLHIHTRLQAPQVSIDSLLNTTEASPLFMLGSLHQLQGIDGFTKKEEKKIRHHARLLCCTINRAFYPRIANLDALINAPEVFEDSITNLITQIKDLSGRWLNLKNNFLGLPLQPKTVKCLNWVDEAIGNQLHLVCQQILSYLPEESNHKDELRIWMRKNKKRISKNSKHFMKNSHQNILRSSALKKYTYSALFLNGVPKASRDWLQHIALGVAAGIAMTWAVFAQVFAFFKLGLNLDQGMSSTLVVYFFLIAVVSYILKDRIKATIGRYLSKRISQWSLDHQTIYNHEEKEHLAESTERVSRSNVKELPEEIKACWENLYPVPMSLWVGGELICYEREFEIKHKKGEQILLNYSGIHDIIRYHVGQWLVSFDDTKKTMLKFNKRGQPVTQEINRLYEIILSIQNQSLSGIETHHFRVLMSQKGLKSIKPIDNKAIPPETKKN